MRTSSNNGARLLLVLFVLFSSARICQAEIPDDPPDIIPEMLLRYLPKNGGQAHIKATLRLYRRTPANETTTIESVFVEQDGGSHTWQGPARVVAYPKAMLDWTATLVIDAKDVDEYQVYFNLPDTRYTTAFRASQDAAFTTQRLYHDKAPFSSSTSTRIIAVRFTTVDPPAAPAGKTGLTFLGRARDMQLMLGFQPNGRSAGYATLANRREIFQTSVSPDVTTEYYGDGKLKWIRCPQMLMKASYQETNPRITINCYDWSQVVDAQYNTVGNPGLIYNLDTSETPNGYGGYNVQSTITRTEGSTALAMGEAHQYGGLPVAPPVIPSGGEFVRQQIYDWVPATFAGNRQYRRSDATLFYSLGSLYDTDQVLYRNVARSTDALTPGETVLKTGEIVHYHWYESQYFVPLLKQSFEEADAQSAPRYPSTFDWYAIPEDKGEFLKLKSRQWPDGRWEYYHYYKEDSDFLSRGLPLRVTRPYKDGPTLPVDNAPNSEVTEFTYAENWDGSKTLPAEVKTTVRGQTAADDRVIRRIVYDYSASFENGQPVTANGNKLWITQKDEYTDSTHFLRSVSKKYRDDAEDAGLRGLPYSVTNPDGTREVFAYHYGNLDAEGHFQPVAGGGYFRTINVKGHAETVPNSSFYVQYVGEGGHTVLVDPIVIAPGKNTYSVVLRDPKGRTVLTENLASVFADGIFPIVYDAGISSTESAYNFAGELIQQGTRYTINGQDKFKWDYLAEYTDINGNELNWASIQRNADGSFKNSGNATGRKQYQMDSDGSLKKFYYDDFGRVKRMVTLAPPAAPTAPASIPQMGSPVTGLLAQPAVQVNYEYDGDNRITAEFTGPVTSDGNPDATAMKSATVYAPDGRLESKTAPGGYTTTYSYAAWGRIVTETLPGGATRITENYLDGRVKSITGTAQVAEYFDYGFDSVSNLPKTTKRLGSAASTRLSEEVKDWLGRVRVERSNASAASDGQVEKTHSFNDKGQLASSSVTGLAPFLFFYNDFGELWKSGQDLNGNGALDAASLEPINVQETSFIHDNATGAVWEKTVNQAYPTSADAPLTIRQTWVRKTGFDPTFRAEVREIDASNNATTTKTYAVEDQGLFVTQATTPLFTDRGESIARAGRVVRVLGPGGVFVHYGFDAYGRLDVTQDRAGQTFRWYRLDAQGRECPDVFQVRQPDNSRQEFGYDSAGRISVSKTLDNKSVARPTPESPGKFTRFAYNSRGDATRVWGDVPYPVERAYADEDNATTGEVAGLLKEETTFRAGTGWTDETWPAGVTGDKTRYRYFLSTGLLKEKEDPNGQKIIYAYNVRGDLSKRTWQRGSPAIETTYEYRETSGEATGDLKKVSYNDGTVPVIYSYTRLGLLETVADSAGSRAFSYRASDRQLEYESLPGFYGASKRMTYTYDTSSRNDGFWYGVSQPARETWVATAFQAASGRIGTIDSPLGLFTCAYLANSRHLETVTGPTVAGAVWKHAWVRKTDSHLLESIESDWGTPAFAKHFLGYDQKNRNDSVTQTGSLYGRYGIGLSTHLDYSDRNEVLNARTEISNSPQTAGTELQGRGFGYLYDPAGNRTGSRFRDEPVLPYVPNALNQYASRGRPDVVPVSGLVDAAATVTVDSQTVPAANRQNDYFHYLRPRSGPAQEIVVRATLSNPNRVAEERRTVIAPGTSEAFQYDLDGNLTQDEQWDYTYDGENRLIAMATRDLGGSVVRKRLEFVYDYLGRRVEKKVSTRLNTTPVTWRLDLDLRFVYQGWTLVAELDALTDPSAPALVRSYVHGLDISGSFQGAAGVGGLLGMLTHSGSPHAYYAANDARGNVIGLLDGQTGTMAAQYEYGAFGERLGAGGPMAGVNGLQFSSKYYDPETELCNFGFRYYNPSLGRFINRDPQNELGRIQLVSFGGRGVQVWSYLGLASANGAEAAQKQDASLQNTSLPHSNEQVSAGPKNSLIPGMTDFSKKGYSVGAAAFRTPTLSLGGDNSYYSPYQSGISETVGGDANLYAYVGNSPYSAIDPLGLWSWNWVPNWLNGMFSSGYSGPTYMSPSGRYSYSAPVQGPDHTYLGRSREITGEPYDTTPLKNAMIPLRIAADNYPGIGTANTAYTAFTGKDAITRETVATEDRWMASAATAGTVLGAATGTTRLLSSGASVGNAMAELLVSSTKARSHLRSAMGPGLGEAHHVIPWASRRHPLVQKAARGGFNINGLENGVRLQDHSWAGHPQYNAAVNSALEGYHSLNPHLTSAQAAQLLNTMAISIRQHLLSTPLPLR